MKSHHRSAFWCSSGSREEAERKTCFLFVLARFNGQLWFLSIEVSEADFYMPAAGSGWLKRNRHFSNKSLKQLQYSSPSFLGK